MPRLSRVERVLRSSGCALVWISHDPEQPLRVGGRVLELPGGTLTVLPEPTPDELAIPPAEDADVTPQSQVASAGTAN